MAHFHALIGEWRQITFLYLHRPSWNDTRRIRTGNGRLGTDVEWRWRLPGDTDTEEEE